MSSLSLDLLELGRVLEAEKLARKALDIEQRVEGLESTGAMYAENNLADVITAEGHYQEAERLYREALRAATKANAGTPLGVSWYGLAAMPARAGRHDKAIEYLGDAVDSGLRRPKTIASDPDLKSLHGDPRFQAILAKAQRASDNR